MANPYDKVDTSKLSGYALKYALARQGGSDDSQAHTQANAATGGSGITQSDWGSISAGHPTGQTYTPNAYNPSYAASSYDEPGYNYYVSQQQQQQQPLQQSQPEIRYQTDPQLMQTIQQLQSQISSTPTVNDIMSSPAMQQMQQAILGQMQGAMKSARADLAARGVLGSGSTPAVERMGQVAGHYGQQLGALVPQMMGAASQMQGARTDALQNLVSLLSGMDQQSWQRGLSEFQTYAPYYRFTAGQVAEMAQNLVNTYPQLSIDDATRIVNGWMQGGY